MAISLEIYPIFRQTHILQHKLCLRSVVHLVHGSQMAFTALGLGELHSELARLALASIEGKRREVKTVEESDYGQARLNHPQ